MKAGHKVILSGIQPTGVPHLGNYLGAIRPWVHLQKQSLSPAKNTGNSTEALARPSLGNQCASSKIVLSVVDLHAITQPQQPSALRDATLEMGMSLLACGIDPSRSILFRQSRISQHTELAWTLFCRTPVSWLTRMHQWKTKVADQQGGAAEEDLNGHVGLLSYPVLQAADILLYNATHVPVGEDQSQHINLTATIAKSFNSHYKKQIFTIPVGMYAPDGTKRIMSLKTPSKKMSKSDPLEQSRISILDSPDMIKAKIKKATVDSITGISYTPSQRPGISNLLHILLSMDDSASSWSTPLQYTELQDQVQKTYGHLNNSSFKELVTESVVEHLRPIQERYQELKRNPAIVEDAFRKGEEEASAIAAQTLKTVYEAVGLR